MKWFTYLFCLGMYVSFSNCSLFDDKYPTLEPYNYDISKDTTVQRYLEVLHGVWIRKGYLNTLKQHKSLHLTNEIYQNGFVMLHIDKKQFHKYYLPIIAQAPQDTMLKRTFLYFEKRTEGVMLSLVTNHKSYTVAKVPFIAYLTKGRTDFELVIQSLNERIRLLTDKYEKIATDLPPPNDMERPFATIESFVKANLVSGSYYVLNPDYEVIQPHLELTSTGNLSIEQNERLIRYTLWSTATTDYLRFNLIGANEHSFLGAKDYIIQFNRQDLILYESVKIPNQKNKYRLEKRWILKRKENK